MIRRRESERRDTQQKSEAKAPRILLTETQMPQYMHWSAALPSPPHTPTVPVGRARVWVCHVVRRRIIGVWVAG